MTITHPAAAGSPVYDVLAVETTQAILVGALHNLALELLTLRELATATKTRPNGFLTGEARLLQDEMIRKEKAEYAARRNEDRAKAVPPNPLPRVGASPAPVKIPAIDLLHRVHTDLLDAAVDAHRHLEYVDKVLLATLAARDLSIASSSQQVLAHLVDLAQRVTHITWLSTSVTAIEKSTETVKAFVHGERKTKLDAMLCPWCGQKTLTLYQDQGVIICGRNHDTGKYEPCICTFRDCDCKTKWHRHSWNQPQKGEWRKLLGLVRDADRRRAEQRERETRKREAAERLALAIFDRPAADESGGAE